MASSMVIREIIYEEIGMKLIIVLLVLAFALPVYAQSTYELRVTTELDPESHTINFRTLTEDEYVWEIDPTTGDKVIYTSIPVSMLLTDKTIHSWYIPVEMENIPDGFTEAWYSISYDASALNLFPSQTIIPLQGSGEIHLEWFSVKQGSMEFSLPIGLGTLRKRTGPPQPKG